MKVSETDICIIGAGPAGLFAVFEAGLLRMKCHVIDALPQIGGQLTEVYPLKPIYDIPGYPVILARELADRLVEQAAPFKPQFSLGERVEKLEKTDSGRWLVCTNDETVVNCKAIVIAGGLGCFEPRKPDIEGLAEYEGSGVQYMVKNPEQLRGRRVVISGGGDSALDWTVFLTGIAARVTLIHRGSVFRGSPDMAEKVMMMAARGEIDLMLQSRITAVSGSGHLQQIEVLDAQGGNTKLDTDMLIPLFGLSPKLGPIAEWGLNLDRSAITVDPAEFQTNIPGIYAIGDINTYPGKLKLILSGFHEAALMAQSAFRQVYPGEKLTFKYTTVYGIPT